MQISYNFLLAALNLAQRSGSVSVFSEVAGGEAENLLSLEDLTSPWIPGTVGPHATEFLVSYQSATQTRALALTGGRCPIANTKFRIRRGNGLLPIIIQYSAKADDVNVTSDVDVTVDPRVANGSTYLVPFLPGLPWSITYHFDAPAWGWSEERDQKLVILAFSSVSGGDPELTIEVKDENGSFVLQDKFNVAHATSDSTRPIFSVRLTRPQMAVTANSQAVVRMSGDFNTTGVINLHGLAIVPGIDPGTVTHDSEWQSLLPGDFQELSGGAPVELIGTATDVSLIYDYRDQDGNSIVVTAPETHVDIDVSVDPNDPEQTLDLGDQIERPGSFSFRHFFEGPGLSGMELQKGIEIELVDLAFIKRSLGGHPRAIQRRMLKRVSFRIGKVPPDIGAEQIGELLARAGTTHPVLFIVLPAVPSLNRFFSLLGLLEKKPKIVHTFGTRSDSKQTLLEL